MLRIKVVALVLLAGSATRALASQGPGVGEGQAGFVSRLAAESCVALMAGVVVYGLILILRRRVA